MRIRKKMLSVFCAAMLLGVITSVTVPQVQASDEQTKKVDGSYLTMQESASGTSQNEDTKGQYIMLGECSVTKAGLLWSSIFVTLMANKIGGLQFGIYRNCQISSRVFHTAVAALPLTKANRSDFE